ncbi:MAG: hypothetical protein QOI86_5302 [Actinomycetota bacterium]|jgi:quinol monooxygenase YgiN|nr:hypothetical protein [Actinomycetota bacterium]
MSDAVSWVVELTVRSEALEGFRALTQEMVEATRAEPGALVYERFVSADGLTVHLCERYTDSDAALAHLRVFGDRFAGRFAAMVERRRVCVYGTPSADLRTALDAIGAEYLRPLDGFAR